MTAVRAAALSLLLIAGACAGPGINPKFGFPDSADVPADQGPKPMPKGDLEKLLAEMKELGKSHAREAQKEIEGKSN